MAQWSEMGILRKNKNKETQEELLVFGYACKLFRDDEKALYIDQGKHLIPWMGNDNLKIDRYDCRGALSDIGPFEATKEDFDTKRWLGLNESERKLEELCDNERYYSLKMNEEEEEIYKEEEEKRQKTHEYQYTYDVPMEPSQNVPAPNEKEEDFIPSPILDVPSDFNIPKTIKENTRIEKTASFVSKQGPQMEILIKAKQSNNPQFSFLNQNDPLHKYYRHVLNAIKSGKYEPISTSQKEISDENENSSDHYLHPSLVSTVTPSLLTETTTTTSTVIPITTLIPTSATTTKPIEQQTTSTTTSNTITTSTITSISYKPSANCSYSQLVNRIQQKGNQFVDFAQKFDSNQQQSLTYEQQQQYYQYYYTSQYYEYYKQLYQQNVNENQPLPELDSNIQNYLHNLAYSQYIQNQKSQQTNPYAQIVSNVSSLLPETMKETEIINENKNDSNNLQKPLLSLAQYGSDSDNDDDDDDDNDDLDNDNSIPTDEIQLIIEKMASYVLKNGQQFEEIVKAKNDPRFDFLNKNHKYYEYYRNKIEQYKTSNVSKLTLAPPPPPPPLPPPLPLSSSSSSFSGSLIKPTTVIHSPSLPLSPSSSSSSSSSPSSPSSPTSVPLLSPSSSTSSSSSSTSSLSATSSINKKITIEKKKILTPVSFSLKRPNKEEPHKDIKNALAIDDDDDDDDVDDNGGGDDDKKNNNNKNDNKDNKGDNNNTKDDDRDNHRNNGDNDDCGDNNKSIIDEDPILEMIDLTDDYEERKGIKRANDKIKDKLAAAAREKLALVVKDRALQLERKKKATAFLKLKAESEKLIKTNNSCNNNYNNTDDNTITNNSDIKNNKKTVGNIVIDSFGSGGGVDGGDGGDDKKKKKKKSCKRRHSRSHRENKRKKSKKKRKQSNSSSSSINSNNS